MGKWLEMFSCATRLRISKIKLNLFKYFDIFWWTSAWALSRSDSKLHQRLMAVLRSKIVFKSSRFFKIKWFFSTFHFWVVNFVHTVLIDNLKFLLASYVVNWFLYTRHTILLLLNEPLWFVSLPFLQLRAKVNLRLWLLNRYWILRFHWVSIVTLARMV